jgi:hypothetical protein
MVPALKFDTTTPATYEDRIKALVLLGGLPARESNDPHAEKAAYHLALEGVTRYGLQEAVKTILRGSLGHTFFPSPVELRQQCDRAMEWVFQEERRIRHREELFRDRREFEESRASRTPEQIERVKALTAKLKADLEGESDDSEEKRRAFIRAKYGITAEELAKLPDRPLPGNWKQA